ncbi:hypothetical protein ACHAXR_007212 [Thalassiosira sp. AJA248-18]
MNKHISTLSLLIAALSVPSTTAMMWQLDTFQCDNDSDPFDIDITVLCDDTTSCAFGDTAVVSGDLTAYDDFTNNHVTLKACVAGVCPTAYTKTAGKLCDFLTPVGNQTCGEMGDYEINDEIKMPKEKDVPSGSALLSSMITIKIEIGEDDACESSAGTITSSYQMESITITRSMNGSNENKAYPTSEMFVFLALFAIVAVTAMYASGIRRRRREQVDNEKEGGARASATRYAEF